MFPRSIFCISIALVTAGATASGAQSTPPVSAPPMLHACVGKIGGFARIVPSRNDCILEFETFVSWNQNGVAGAQGPTGPNGIAGLAGPSGLTGPSGAAGPQGITGPVGPTGPRGAGLTQNFTAHSAFGSGFPSGIVSFLNYPITGFYTSSIQPLANVVQQIPIGCIATNFTVTATGAMGNSVASVSLLLAPSPAAASTSYHTTPVCQLVSNAGQTVSCTAAGPFTIPAGSAVTFNINLSNGTDFTNAQLITSFSCQ